MVILLIFGVAGFIYFFEQWLERKAPWSPRLTRWTSIVGCLAIAWIPVILDNGSVKTLQENDIQAIISLGCLCYSLFWCAAYAETIGKPSQRRYIEYPPRE